MKKILITFVAVCLLTIGIFFTVNQKDTDTISKKKNGSVDFLICNNENGVFDPSFEKGSNMQFSIPEYSPALPFSDIKKLEELELVEAVYPYYPIFIFDEVNGQNAQLTYWQSDDHQKQILEMPLFVPGTNGGYDGYIRELRLPSVTDYELFYQMYDESKEEHDQKTFIKLFNCDSGIYISKEIYAYLNVDENETELTIEAPVQVPVLAKMTESEHSNGINTFIANEYTVVKYQTVNVTLEVQGVINTGLGNGFCGGLDIVIPYNLSKEIYENIDYSQIIPENEQMIWQPNTYIVRCKSETSLDQLGQTILTNINQIYLTEYNYNLNFITTPIILYNHDETFIFGK